MKNTSVPLVLCFLLGACGGPAGDPQSAPAENPAIVLDAPAQKLPPPLPGHPQEIYTAAVADPARSDTDRERDAGRKPAEVLAFFRIGPGMQVFDLYSGGGYYAELLSYVVGPTGSVTAHNNQPYLGFAADEIATRYSGDRLPNVAQLLAENNELTLEAGRYDAVTMILAYHDVYYADPENGWEQVDGPRLLAEIHKALKPGGLVGVVDHYAPLGSPSATGNTTHRIDLDLLVRDFSAAGFVLEDTSDLLRNLDDDRSILVFDPAVRGKTDRFVLRFRKPQ
ncbi:MAG: methyltransferase domain-containing protein [Gammaproteobacteria bacterium]|nr:methyltransferase domain-containing protein [Gammaproteobacteria bacterium]MDH4254396.1 methyltransferase domain-containing protein [Gammaproteobacteria bacterium]MDH5309329.1 methyltransferase domain-containing protein [Gammaproteobacteria bacterium]